VNDTDAGPQADTGQTLNAQVSPDVGLRTDAGTEMDAGSSEDTGVLVYEYQAPDPSICDETLTTTAGYLCYLASVTRVVILYLSVQLV